MKVLIIQLARMGDLIQTLPLITRLWEHKNAHITLLCVKEFSDILRPTRLVHRFLKISASDAAEICYRNNKDKLYELLTHPYLKEPYDLVINLTHDFMSALLAGSIPSDLKSGLIREESDPLGYIVDKWGKYLFSVVKNRKANSFNLVDIHIGMGRIPHKPVRFFLSTDGGAESRIEKLLEYFGIARAPLVGIHLGASRSQRVWPLESFVRLAELMVKELKTTVVLTGSGAEEINNAKKFVELYRQRNKGGEKTIINLAGKTSVLELAALLKKMRLFIACDTGPLHIAAGVGTPTLGLYMATAFPGETAPYGEKQIVVTPNEICYPCRDPSKTPSCNFSCKDAITPEIILEVSRRVLQSPADQPFNWGAIGEGRVRIMVSQFLSNGTLCYVPLSSRRDSQFALQVAERYMWDGVLGLEPDPNLISLPNADVCMKELLIRISILKNMKASSDGTSGAPVAAPSIERMAELSYLAHLMDKKTTSSLRTYLSLYQMQLNNEDFASENIKLWNELNTDIEKALAGCMRALKWLNEDCQYA